DDLIELFADEKFRRQFATMTRTAGNDLYHAANTETPAGRRLAAWFEANYSTIAFTPDPDRDALAITKIRDAIEARPLARGPKELIDFRDRLKRAEAHMTFKEILGHLKSGRGIAVRPKRQMLVGVAS